MAVLQLDVVLTGSSAPRVDCLSISYSGGAHSFARILLLIGRLVTIGSSPLLSWLLYTE